MIGRKLTQEDYLIDERFIYIPASAFSDVEMELIKTTETQYYENDHAYYTFSNVEPNGYLAFKGPGINQQVSMGADSKTHSNLNMLAHWGLNGATSFARSATCKISDYPNVVVLPTISEQEIKNGKRSQAPFSINVECESSRATNKAIDNGVVLGLVIHQANAVSKARELGLTTSSGGMSWLLDDHYGEAQVASGVGIRIYNQMNNNVINLLPDNNVANRTNDYGWYKLTELMTLTSNSNKAIYSGNFVASLEALPNQTISAGKVNAQLQIVVDIQ